jgi:hypothetical protein
MAVMPTTKVRKIEEREATLLPGLHELDRVKLVKAVSDKGRALGPGLQGTVVLCHGLEAYEVEFDGIDDFFQISAKDLEKV